MNKKILTGMLIGLIMLQLLVPGYMIYRNYDTLRTGEAFMFDVRAYDPYDPFRGRYVALRTIERTYDTYAVLDRNADGFAVISSESGNEKPETGIYAKNLKLDRYYMNENMAPIADRIPGNLNEGDRLYLLVMVKNGHYVIEGLYLNGVAIEEHINAELSK